jgi:hypothetical protein
MHMYDTLAIVVAIAFGPVAAVVITLWHQGKEREYAAQERLFFTLMTHRKSIPLAIDWVRSLNLVDVVYSRHPKVIDAWHELFDYYHTKPMDDRQLSHKTTGLLSAMAKSLGYKELEQRDIDRYYIPEGQMTEATRLYETQTEFLRVLKATERLSAEPRKQ